MPFYKMNFYCRDLIKSFATNDLLNWPEMKMKYSSLLCENPHMAPTNPNSEFYWEELHKRVIEHVGRVGLVLNIKFLSFYTHLVSGSGLSVKSYRYPSRRNTYILIFCPLFLF